NYVKKIFRDTGNAIDIYSYVYRPIYNERGFKTMAYELLTKVFNDMKQKMTLKDYIYKIKSTINAQIWPVLYTSFEDLKKRDVNDIVSKLSNIYSRDIKVLNKNKKIFSFENGAYITYINTFTKQNLKFRDPNFHNAMTDAFLSYSNYDKITVGKTRSFYETDILLHKIKKYTALNHFPKIKIDKNLFNKHIEEWRDIPTPAFDSIFSYQNIPKEAMDWIWAFWGRFLYFINDADDMQMLLFIKGPAGNGKSLLVKILSTILG